MFDESRVRESTRPLPTRLDPLLNFAWLLTFICLYATFFKKNILQYEFRGDSFIGCHFHKDEQRG